MKKTAKTARPEEAPSIASAWPSGPRPSSRYSTLARALVADIQADKYRIGERIPTEAELQLRFGVSRYTVREALRELKGQGIVAAHPGIGTVVRGKPGRPHFVQGVTSINDLIQLVEKTRLRVFERREIVADDALALRLGCKAGQHWLELSVIRTIPKEMLPIALLTIYLRPEFADVVGHIGNAEHPVFELVERRHGVHTAEVRQEIVATVLKSRAAKLLHARVGAPALQITRHYLDAQDRPVTVSIGQYPSERFTYTTTLRSQRNPPG